MRFKKANLSQSCVKMLVNRQTINCAFAFFCKKFALFELADPMRRKIFTQLFLQGAARLGALQVPKRQLCGNLTSIGRMCSNPLCLRKRETALINKENIKGFVIGAAAALFICTSAVFAQNLEKTVNAVYNNIKLVINGAEVTPKDANGNTVEPFIIDGTTYLPVRAVAGALGQSVDWDGETNTVYIGEKPQQQAKEFTPDASVMNSYKGETLATVGNQAIKGSLYNYFIAQSSRSDLLQTYADNYSADSNLQEITIQSQPAAKFLAESASEQIGQCFALNAAARDSKFTVPESEVENLWNSYYKSFANDDEYRKMLADFATDDETIKNFVRITAVANNYAESIYNAENEKTYTDDEIYKYFTENYVHAKHILVDDEQTAKDIIAQLKKGKSFDDALKESGTDPGQPDEGYFFTKGQMVLEFENAAFALKENSYTTEPVKTSYGYHIVYRYKISKEDAKDKADFIKKTLASKESQKKFNDIFSKYSISYTDKYNEYISNIK